MASSWLVAAPAVAVAAAAAAATSTVSSTISILTYSMILQW